MFTPKARVVSTFRWHIIIMLPVYCEKHLGGIDCYKAGSKLADPGKDSSNPVVTLVPRIWTLNMLNYQMFMRLFGPNFLLIVEFKTFKAY